MSYLTGIITLIVGLALSIALHELGHLVPAKKFGVLTTQYMLGFGPTLWSKKFGETEFGVKLIWLGGYVRMVGMYAPNLGWALSPVPTAVPPMASSRARESA